MKQPSRDRALGRHFVNAVVLKARFWPFTSFRVREQSGRFQNETDIRWHARQAGSVANDPKAHIERGSAGP
jgi:hypothetical protein